MGVAGFDGWSADWWSEQVKAASFVIADELNL
jgi:hypothetical protein